MFHSRLHPTPTGLALGVFIIALWAALWLWFLIQVARGPEGEARLRNDLPGLTQLRPAKRATA